MNQNDSTNLIQQTYIIQGTVQGVGFRPFIYHLAQKLSLKGYVSNTPNGVSIVVEGEKNQLFQFSQLMNENSPKLCRITHLQCNQTAWSGYDSFTIKETVLEGNISPFILPDTAPCETCLKDIQDPKSAFFQFPFTSCSTCGPRYSIVRKIPFDRAHTAMAEFTMCKECQDRYTNPSNFRFHAQTLSCPNCGPRLTLRDKKNNILAHSNNHCLEQSVQLLKEGKILAVKGVGGYQLWVDALNAVSLNKLRRLKQRSHKPFAVLFKNLEALENFCNLEEKERQLLQSPSSPIVIVVSKQREVFPWELSHHSNWLGAMLPSSPLHYLIANRLHSPLVVTSGNIHQSPLITDDEEAFDQLHELADAWLSHNRTIERALEDSVMRIIGGNATVLRNGRGISPTVIETPLIQEERLAVGNDLNNSVSIQYPGSIIQSQFIGNLYHPGNRQRFIETVEDFCTLYQTTPREWVHDLHPDAFTSYFSQQQSIPTRAIPHHHAHAFSCMAEHQLQPPLLAFTWDGNGLSEEGMNVGSEVYQVDANKISKVASFEPFPLLGGDIAAKEPYRMAFTLLTLAGAENFISDFRLLDELMSTSKAQIFKQMLQQKTQCPLTTSAGRLFDAVSCLLGLCGLNHYQGQAAIELEQLADQSSCMDSYPYQLTQSSPIQIDWKMILVAIVSDVQAGKKTSDIAAKFHNTLANIIFCLAKQAKLQKIVFSGGCFQNAHLVKKAQKLLIPAGYKVYIHERVPPNDSGLSVGQLYRQIVTIPS